MLNMAAQEQDTLQVFLMDIRLFQTPNQNSNGWTKALIITLALLLIIPIIGF